MDREPWITPDGKQIYFRSARPAPDYPDNDSTLWETRRLDNGSWSEPVLMPQPINLNGAFNHCPMLLRDGKTLCFASTREGGYGESDVWCAERRRDGAYADPVNLGPNINSPEAEWHFYPDLNGEWVYFTSAKPGGFGGLDVYATRRDEAAGGWHPGINLGPGVNTPDSDLCSSVTPDGKSMLFFSNQAGGTGTYPSDFDIYVAPMSDLRVRLK